MKNIINEITYNIQEEINKIIFFFKKDISLIRTGKLNPDILSSIYFTYFNNKTYLNEVSSLSSLNYNSILIKIWDKSLLNIIKKAILDSNLGLTPIERNGNLMITFPVVTEEFRKKNLKLLKKKSEQTKVAIRSKRKFYMNMIKKNKDISQDIHKILIKKIDNIINLYISKVDDIFIIKKKDIMNI